VLPAVLLHLLEVGEVGALPGEVDEVEEGHPAKADVEERLRRTRLDVLLDVAVHGLVGALRYVPPGQPRLQVPRHLPHLHAADLVVQGSQRHGQSTSSLSRSLGFARVGWAMEWGGEFVLVMEKVVGPGLLVWWREVWPLLFTGP
jgi:hypothetical protein